MKVRRLNVIGASFAASALLACSTGDTVIALNVTVGDNVAEVKRLHVVIGEAGHADVLQDYAMLPKVVHVSTDDAGNDAGASFLLAPGALPAMRITLPSSWTGGTAHIQVTSYDASDALYLTADPVDVSIVEHGAVAAFVNLGLPMPDGGASDGGDAGSAEDGAPEAGSAGPDSGVLDGGAVDASGDAARD